MRPKPHAGATRFVVAWLAIAATAPAARAERLEAQPSGGRIVVNAYKAGVLSGFAHDHHFAVTEWRATAELQGGDPSSASVVVVLSAASLRDTQKSLSDEDRKKVDAQAAGPEVLDAANHPQIEFRSERIELTPAAGAGSAPVRGTIHGRLTLRGRSIALDVPFEAERPSGVWLARGTARVKQSDLGIKPFSGFGGTVAVKDELTIDFAFSLPAAGGDRSLGAVR